MIDSSLLFQMGYLMPSFSWRDGAFLGVLLIFGCFVFFYPRNQKREVISLSPLPDIKDPDFESKLATYLRTKLAMRYAPTRARSHTSREIEKYARNHPYIKTLKYLEEQEYRSIRLTEKERHDLVRQLKL